MGYEDDKPIEASLRSIPSGGALHPKIADDGPSRAVRNAVGVTGPDEAVFAISDGPVSFGRLARFFRDGLHCPDALYLDGAISALWAPGLNRRRQSVAPRADAEVEWPLIFVRLVLQEIEGKEAAGE